MYLDSHFIQFPNVIHIIIVLNVKCLQVLKSHDLQQWLFKPYLM
jgi:hypothetical protein